MTWQDVYRMAGVLQMEWRHRTLRELWVLYQSYLVERWHHTAHMMQMWVKDKTVKYHEMHPLLKQVVKDRIKVDPDPSEFEIDFSLTP
jgi:hypothetical protein